MTKDLQVVIITGMSGAGKTVASQSFEDLGFYVVDNMPPSLIPKFLEIIENTNTLTKVAMVIDLRTRDFFDELEQKLIETDKYGLLKPRILYLEAENRELVSRYKETRRAHPLSTQGRVMDGILKEKELLESIKNRANVVIDTTNLTPRQLRTQIIEYFNTDRTDTFHVELLSFGFKYGLPIDADIVMDVRFLPNPHYIDELRPQTGLDEAVYDYVMEQPETEIFYNKFMDLLEYLLPGYEKEGKTNLTVAIGCTGGKHRSVALSERIGQKVKALGYPVRITHRDKDKRKESVANS